MAVTDVYKADLQSKRAKKGRFDAPKTPDESTRRTGRETVLVETYHTRCDRLNSELYRRSEA